MADFLLATWLDQPPWPSAMIFSIPLLALLVKGCLNFISITLTRSDANPTLAFETRLIALESNSTYVS